MRRILLTTPFESWHGLLAQDQFFSPLITGLVVCAGWCVLCLGAVESAAPPMPSASVTVRHRFAGLLLTLHLDAPTDPPDHPPRS